MLNSSRNEANGAGENGIFVFIIDLARLRSFTGQAAANDSQNADGGKCVYTYLFVELGEFQLPILVLSTNASSRMIMETDGHNKETYIKIDQSYSLKSSDSILTELGYDDFGKLDRTVANSLLQIFIAAYLIVYFFELIDTFLKMSLKKH